MKHPFDYHRPSQEQVDQITTVREGCKALHATLLELPPCRERSVAITKLEEVSMWANKGIVMHEGPVNMGRDLLVVPVNPGDPPTRPEGVQGEPVEVWRA